jgi:hypothetical protein
MNIKQIADALEELVDHLTVFEPEVVTTDLEEALIHLRLWQGFNPNADHRENPSAEPRD